MSTARYSVGLDLGTTNTALACAALDGKDAPVPFALEQVVAAGEHAPRPLLPSFLYLPADVELPAGAMALPWDKDPRSCVGTFARERAASVPGRVVSSAKSWLCHAGVDRRAPLLPAGAPDDLAKLSPVEVSARILGHLVRAWDHAHPDTPLAEQDVVLTVPASFDAVARALTEEAARSVGLERLTLLEEPQAALYAWVAKQGDAWRKHTKVGDLILVVDLGGGTTDFSLIEVKDEGGTLALHRVAVGDHILLGGDNMDLALAHRCKAKLEADGKVLDDWQLRALMHGCRAAKEELLENERKQKVPVAIPGRGSKLVGGTLRTELLRDELNETLLEGFFPEVPASARPHQAKKAGLTTLGLPYAHDAGITRHLAAFLDGRTPTKLLFNGGVTKSPLLRERIAGIVKGWLGGAFEVIDSPELDLAVAVGAAYYGRARTGKGVRIKGGASRAYYVGIERSELAVPGVPPRVDAVCIAPLGMEEGSEIELPMELGLVVGEPATFRFFSSSSRREDVPAATMDPKKAELAEVAPIEATLQGPAGALVPVKLHARVTEVGTLELSAVESATHKRHKLEFNIRVE
ncbi:MAG: molecular chaperone DnaK [Deltaproteobacteria bacterium RBG_16_71_12]|nr:MAG: molecular chaperone DnaK [Deltaproteobacteria bacterium RBG_16_71_12]